MDLTPNLGIEEFRDLRIMNYKKFEELPCWIRARELCRIIFGLINEGKFRNDFSLKNQAWAAGGSVMDNIAESK
jgi:hypothetical protein